MKCTIGTNLTTISGAALVIDERPYEFHCSRICMPASVAVKILDSGRLDWDIELWPNDKEGLIIIGSTPSKIHLLLAVADRRSKEHPIVLNRASAVQVGSCTSSGEFVIWDNSIWRIYGLVGVTLSPRKEEPNGGRGEPEPGVQVPGV